MLRGLGVWRLRVRGIRDVFLVPRFGMTGSGFTFIEGQPFDFSLAFGASARILGAILCLVRKSHM